MRTVRRRRHEAKTDYKARLTLLKAGRPRLVVRKTNRYIIAQFVVSEQAQDTVIVGVFSKLLLQKGWPEAHAGSLKSLPAAYLTGLLLGKLAKGKVTNAILDLGMYRNVHKSRVYAVLKGVLDAGILITHDPAALPGEQEFAKNKELNALITKVKL